MPGDTQSLVPGSKTATTPKLFQPVQVGEIQLAHRVVLPPLARYRADTEGVPTDLNVTYYTQRGSTPGTLLISEASVVSPYGGGGPYIPGAFNDTQVAGWKKVRVVLPEFCVVTVTQYLRLGIIGRRQRACKGELLLYPIVGRRTRIVRFHACRPRRH